MNSLGGLQALGQGFNVESVGAGGVVLDRSRVRILVCDPSTSPDVSDLLRRCSYQVMAVQTARQVLEVLKNGASDVDLVLVEVEQPMGKGFKMLKHITKHQRLKQIPIVMMSAHDEMAVVVKCLRLGAADYLVKPLRTNELLNLWTHLWRRRRMLGLPEKHLITGTSNINNHPIHILLSDTSDSNTNSTDLFSEDSNDRKLGSKLDSTSNINSAFSNHWRSSPALDLTLKPFYDASRGDKGTTLPRPGQVSPHPKKIELKITPSSAFLSYANFRNQTTAVATERQPVYPPKGKDVHNHTVQQQSVVTSIPPEVRADNPPPRWEPVNNTFHPPREMGDRQDGSLSSNHAQWSAGEQQRATYPALEQIPSIMHVPPPKDGHIAMPGISPLAPRQFLPPGLVASPMPPTAIMHPALQLYHGLPHDVSFHVGPSHAPLLGVAVPSPSNFPYFSYTVPVLQPPDGKLPPTWSSVPLLPSVPVVDHKLGQSERREAALSKFRKKRKDRCFEKKIRYFSRKRLAEQRPRIRGQFVRQANGMDIIDCGEDTDEEDQEEDNNRPATNVSVDTIIQ